MGLFSRSFSFDSLSGIWKTRIQSWLLLCCCCTCVANYAAPSLLLSLSPFGESITLLVQAGLNPWSKLPTGVNKDAYFVDWNKTQEKRALFFGHGLGDTESGSTYRLKLFVPSPFAMLEHCARSQRRSLLHFCEMEELAV